MAAGCATGDLPVEADAGPSPDVADSSDTPDIPDPPPDEAAPADDGPAPPPGPCADLTATLAPDGCIATWIPDETGVCRPAPHPDGTPCRGPGGLLHPGAEADPAACSKMICLSGALGALPACVDAREAPPAVREALEQAGVSLEHRCSEEDIDLPDADLACAVVECHCQGAGLSGSDCEEPVCVGALAPAADGAPCPPPDVCSVAECALDEPTSAPVCRVVGPLVCDQYPSATCDVTAPCDPATGCAASLLQPASDAACGAAPPPVCHTPPTCQPDHPAADPATGCVGPLPLSDVPCDDLDLCTAASECLAGVCTAGPPAGCPDDGDPCTIAACAADTGECLTKAAPDGGACSDADPCTVGEQCLGGACSAGTAIVCPQDDDPCTLAACDPGSGECMDSPAPDGVACSDADPCTEAESCVAGVCEGIPVVCEDDDPCTVAEACQADGTCAPSAVIDCPDGEACQASTCNPEGGCELVAKPDGASCGITWCAAGDLFVTEICDQGACVVYSEDCGAAAEPCVLADCTLDGCTTELEHEGGECYDDDPCTITTECDLGACVPSSPEFVAGTDAPVALNVPGSAGAAIGAAVAVLPDGHSFVGLPGALVGGVPGGAVSVVSPPPDAIELQRLELPGAKAHDTFGAALAVQGDVLVVGNPGLESVPGSAVLYRRSEGSGIWEFEQEIDSESAAGNAFGASVAIWGDVVLVGDPGAPGGGSVQAFADSAGGGWVFEDELHVDSAGVAASFGAAVAVYGDTAVIGAPGAKDGAGLAYVFERIGSDWFSTVKLVLPGASNDAAFGSGVAASETGDVLVSAPGNQTSAAGVGTVTTYFLTPDGYALVQTFEATEGGSLGGALAMESHIAVAGVTGSTTAAAVVYRLSQGVWNQVTAVPPPPGSVGAAAALALAGNDVIALGAPATGASGAAWVIVATAEVDCDDQNPCTLDSCVPTIGCVSAPIDGCP